MKNDSIVQTKNFPDAFYIMRQERYRELKLYNRILVSVGKTSSDNSSSPDEIKSFQASKIPEIISHLTNLTLESSSEANSGVVVGLYDYSKIKKASLRISLKIPHIERNITPFWTTFYPLDTAYVEAFYDAILQSNCLVNLPKQPKILDVGSGTGVLSFVLLDLLKFNTEDNSVPFTLYTTDINSMALSCIQYNATNLIKNQFVNILPIQADIYPPIQSTQYPHTYDLIVSFPPFIPVSKLIKREEINLFDKNGDFLNRLLSEAPSRLSDNGILILIYPDMAFSKLKLSVTRIEDMADVVGLKIEHKVKRPFETTKNSQYDILDIFKNDSSIEVFVLSKL